MSKALRRNTPESELVAGVACFLLNQGYNVRSEVPSLGQSADLVATKGRWVTFIEVKVKDWRRALEQCRAHSLVADFVCIALGTKVVSDSAKEKAAEFGIGLIHVANCGSCEWVLRPSVNSSVWKPQRKQLSKTLRVLSYGS